MLSATSYLSGQTGCTPRPTKPLFGVGPAQFNEKPIKVIGDSYSAGLQWLSLDTNFNNPTSTLPSDMAYIRFVGSDYLRGQELEELENNVKIFLTISQKLSYCLDRYAQVLPNSKLLSTELRPLIEFFLHWLQRLKRTWKTRSLREWYP